MSLTPFINTIERVDRSLFSRLLLESIDKGYTPDITNDIAFPDDAGGVAALAAAYAAIKASLGFAVEIFGMGANTKKYSEKVPRIVILGRSRLPGALGSQPDRYYQGIGTDPSIPIDPLTNPLDHYDALELPPQTADFQYDISLVYETAEQNRILTQILSLALPKRGYINWYDQGVDEIEKPFIRQVGFDNYPVNDHGYKEDKYLYVVEDIFETADRPIASPIAPIVEITVEERISPTTRDNPDTTSPEETIVVE